jgi:hypothetical protein
MIRSGRGADSNAKAQEFCFTARGRLRFANPRCRHSCSRSRLPAFDVEERIDEAACDATANSAVSRWLRRQRGREFASYRRHRTCGWTSSVLTGAAIGIALALENLKLHDYLPTRRIRKPRTISI